MGVGRTPRIGVEFAVRKLLEISPRRIHAPHAFVPGTAIESENEHDVAAIRTSRRISADMSFFRRRGGGFNAALDIDLMKRIILVGNHLIVSGPDEVRGRSRRP